MKKKLFGIYHVRKIDEWNEYNINVDGQVFTSVSVPTKLATSISCIQVGILIVSG